MSLCSRLVVVIVGVLCVLHTAPASAQNADPEALYQRGAALRAQHQDAEALAIFQQIAAANHAPHAVAQVALAEGALGRWFDAERHLQAALAATQDPWIVANRATLDEALGTIRMHLGNLEVTATAPGGELWIAGHRVAMLPMTVPARVEAGTVSFELRTPGYVNVTRIATVPPGGLARESVELTRSAVSTVAPTTVHATLRTTPVVGTPARPVTTAHSVPSAGSHAGSTQHTLALAAAIGAGVMVLGGIVTLVVGNGQASAYNNDAMCPGMGAPSQPDACASRLGTVSTMHTLEAVAFVAGGALGAASTVLYLTLPSNGHERATAPAARVACGRGPGMIGLACGVEF